MKEVVGHMYLEGGAGCAESVRPSLHINCASLVSRLSRTLLDHTACLPVKVYAGGTFGMEDRGLDGQQKLLVPDGLLHPTGNRAQVTCN